MIKTRRTMFPPILLIYFAMVMAVGALISTRIHAADHSAVEARIMVPTGTASL